MKEDFLHFIWQHRQFDAHDLYSEQGEELVLNRLGHYNTSSGPDFSEAQIQIAGVEWVGSVEIHLKSSDWYAHGHHLDPAYNNVVLHVVYEHNREVYTHSEVHLPTLVLKGRIRKSQIDQYEFLQHQKRTLPCAAHVSSLGPFIWEPWLDRMLVERLQEKSQEIELLLNQSRNNWMQVYYSLMAGYLGGNFNKLPMFELARKVPFHLIARYKHDAHGRESILLGIARILPSIDAARPWVEQFEHLQRKHQMQVVTQAWKTGRVRPDQAPVNRIVQLSGLIPSLEEMCDRLLFDGRISWSQVDLDVSNYWRHHRNFTDRKVNRAKRLSTQIQQIIDINVHAPLAFAYARATGDDRLRERALSLLVDCPPEENTIIRAWRKDGIAAHHAANSQALLQLRRRYCDLKKCVTCSVGKSIIKKS
jgi:hypothetical protein